MAAECEYAMVDNEAKKSFDYDTGHHRYAGTSVDVIKKYQADAVDAKKLQAKLQHVIDAYASPEWATAAVSRQGSLYDSLRTGLYNTRAPQLEARRRQDRQALEALRAERQPRRPRQGRPNSTEDHRSVARRARARAQRRRRGDDPLLRAERRVREALQRAKRGGQPRQPEARLLHRHPRRAQDGEVHPGHPGARLSRRSLPADARRARRAADAAADASALV